MIRVGGEFIGEPGDTEFQGLIYPDGDIITRHMAERLKAEPHYQSDKLEQALGFVKQRRGAIDCGAWVGGWSRVLTSKFERVLSIEANADNARCVRKNLKGNDNATVLHLAVGDQDRWTTAARETGGANVGSRIVSEGAPNVMLRRIDSLPEVKTLLPHVDYIKIHVNGMELKALKGAAETIKQHKPVLTVVLKPAIADYADSPDAARMFLHAELRYRCAGGERPYEIWVPR